MITFPPDKKTLEFMKRVARLANANVDISSLGFSEHKSPRVDGYYHRKWGIIIKNPKLILDPDLPDKYKVPTVELGNGWVMQPIVKKVELKRAVDILRKDMEKYLKTGAYPDLHYGNVGWYKNRPVMFDW
jgi:hypothetical protein